MFEDFTKIVFRSIKLDKGLYKDPNTFGELVGVGSIDLCDRNKIIS